MSEQSPPGSTPLNGWKEIAGYVGRSVRAVQRWEDELGFPVRRIRTAAGQTVYAFPAEIDEWRAKLNSVSPRAEPEDSSTAADGAASSTPIITPAVPDWPAEPASQRWRWLKVGATAAALVGIGWLGGAYWSQRSSRGAIAQVQWNGNVLQATDAQGRRLWSQDFDSATAQPSEALNNLQMVDLDGDSVTEVIAAVRFSPRGTFAASEAIFGLSNTGAVLWRHVPTEVIQCGDESFTGPWVAKAVSVEDGAGPRRVWIAFAHNTWRPSFVIEITPGGTSSLRYVQAGWIVSLANWATPSGRLLAAGGLLNEFGQASLALVDSASPFSTSPSDRRPFQCGGISAGVRRMFLLPRLETTAPKVPYDFVVAATVVGADLQIRQEGQAFVKVGPDLLLRDYALGDRFFRSHHDGETVGFIPHRADGCPFLTARKTLREWTPSGGWNDLSLVPLPRNPPTDSGR